MNYSKQSYSVQTDHVTEYVSYVHQYQEDHLDLYLHFHHFITRDEKDNIVDPYRVPIQKKTARFVVVSIINIIYGNWLTLVTSWGASLGNLTKT